LFDAGSFTNVRRLALNADRGQDIRGIAIYSFQLKSERKQEEIRESYHRRSLQSVLAMITKRINASSETLIAKRLATT
jgi:hypothetical protein